jgi:hypothetical protein
MTHAVEMHNLLVMSLREILREPHNALRIVKICDNALEAADSYFPCVARPANATNADRAELSAGRKGEPEAPHGED